MAEGFYRKVSQLGLFGNGKPEEPRNQYHDNHNHRSAKNNPAAKVKFDNDRSLLREAEIAEKEGRIDDAQQIRRRLGD